MKSLFKKIAVLAAVCFAALFLYANLRQPSLSEMLEPVHLDIFSLSRVPDTGEAAAMEAALRQQPGVTAVAVDADHRTFSVTYRPDGISPSQLMQTASLGSRFEVREKTFPPMPACPVPPLAALKQKVLGALKIF